ncbi:MAG: glycosyltransferase family 39 protein [Thermoproteus sp. AZ2]|jgi:predicted membrane-bound dolichyl-phosphate-mannose-protein mannosyltransferase|uniref:Glycosyltransferase family 39 protein n=1 Tax=Thermoproteus sp. AZ2 TaxID=1609232 RepID=A0ACC6UYT9_9CREN|nr:MAG: glycosyltransferase [Thermoproteus sp. AZ2]
MRLKLIAYAVLAVIIALYVYYTYITFAGLPPYVSDETWYAPAAYNILKYVFHVSLPMQTPYPNASDIESYLNPEHPPLVKYILALSILALGYDTLAWRLPGWIIGGAAIFVAYLTGQELVKDRGEVAAASAGLLSALVLAVDPNFWALHGIALLDAYAGFFSLLSLYLLIREKRLASSIALGLAFAAKESAFMLLFPYLYYIGELEDRPLKRLTYAVFIPAAIYLALSAPLIAYYGGFWQWMQVSFLHMLNWDMTSGHIAGNAANQISTPWGWFLDINPFYLGYNLYARVNIATMILWAALTPVPFILRDKRLAITAMYAWSIWLGFALVWLVGNHTLFSFYVSDFSPIVDVFVIAATIALVRGRPNRGRAT